MGAFTVLNGPVIEAGQSLSEPLDCTTGSAVRITMPPSWDGGPAAAEITFQVSTDGAMYNNLVRPDGSEVSCSVQPGSAVFLPDEWVRAVAFLKIRSGPSSAPMVQNEQRTFAVALRVEEATAPAAARAPTRKSAAKKKKSRWR